MILYCNLTTSIAWNQHSLLAILVDFPNLDDYIDDRKSTASVHHLPSPIIIVSYITSYYLPPIALSQKQSPTILEAGENVVQKKQVKLYIQALE